MAADGADQINQLIAYGERAAFYGRPGDGIAPLGKALSLCQEVADADRGFQANWLLGVCLSSSGRYGSAISQLHPMLADVSTPIRSVYAGLAATTIASVQRQLNRYQDAHSYDDWAVKTAPNRPEVLTDAWMGLAADWVGQGELAKADLCLARSVRSYLGRDEWRTSLRLDWVRVEISLARSDPDTAVEYAEDALARAEAADAPRHVAKSLLFVGSARQAINTASGGKLESDPAVIAPLRRCAALAASLGALPLVWPAHLLLSRTRPEGDPARGRDRAAAAAALREILGDLPAAIADSWRRRPEIADLI